MLLLCTGKAKNIRSLLIFIYVCAILWCKIILFGIVWKGEIPLHRHHLKNAIVCAMFAALCCLATLVIQVPSPIGGYLNLGDCFVLVAAFLLGPWYGALAGGVGSALADLFGGYVQYAPGTLAIKGMMAMVAGLLCMLLARHRRQAGAAIVRLLAAICGECIMVLGYMVYEAWLLGYGAGALVGLPSNLMQAVLGITISQVLCALLLKIPGIGRHLPYINE